MTKKFLSSLALPLLVILFRPFGIDLSQSIVLGSLVFTIIAWVNGVVNKTYMSIFLLLVFSVFGQTPLRRIFAFPLSENFLLILFSFLFSQGIANSKLAEKLFQPLLVKYTDNIYKLIVSIVVLALALVFIIPQPFSRVIILSLMYYEYFNRIELDSKLKEILLFGVYALSLFVNLIFKRGDIILNTGILSVANLSFTEYQWMEYMSLPSIVMTILGVLLFVFVFRKDFKKYKPITNEFPVEDMKLNKDDKINLGLIGIIVLLWASESIHGINGTIIVIVGSILMYFRKILDNKDLKSVNIDLLIFLTAAFSIGSVMRGSGIADIIFSSFIHLFPESFSISYVLIIMLTTITLHMVLGSNVTTMSVVVPSLMTISAGVINVPILALIVLLSFSCHYILPFHNVVILIGEGRGYFSPKLVTRYGIYLTALVFIGVIFVYLPWWSFMGFI